jgi:1-acyl-sn-glycerol-3-phosphate acyltransferase
VIRTIIDLIILFPISVLFSTAAFVVAFFDRKGNVFRWIPRTWCRCILWIFQIRLEVKGKENLQPGRHYVFVSNHASMFDIPAALVGIPNEVNIIFKKALTYVPIWGWALRYGPFIMIDRTKSRNAMYSLDRAAQTIRNGSSVLLFAEGTRTRDGKLQPFKRGAFSLALKSGVPVVPVTINNTFKIMPKGSWKITPADISVVLGKPIAVDGLEGKAGEQQLMDQVHNSIEQHYIDQS